MNKTIMAMAAVFMFCFLYVPAYARDNLHFNIGENEYAAGIGAHWGISSLRMTETVYRDSSSSELLSEIDWDVGTQMSAGTAFTVAPVNPLAKFGFSLGGNFWWHFPVNGGTMKDADWDESGNEYGYGESILSTLAGMEAEGRLAVHFPIRNKYLIEAAAELWYSRYAAVAHDGWAGWAGDEEKIPLYGAAVEYIQEWISFAPGIGFGIKINNAYIGVRTAVSPFIRGLHIDNHYFRTMEIDDPQQKYITYTDKTKGGIFLRIQGDWQWNITRYVQLCIAVSYRAVKKSRGDTEASATGLAGYYFTDKGMAGAAAQIFAGGLTIKTTL